MSDSVTFVISFSFVAFLMCVVVVWLLLLAAALLLLVVYGAVEWFYRRGFIADFDSKRIFVTGCDSGFGRALVAALDRLGVATVYAACYTDDGARHLVTTSGRIKVLRIDVTDRASIEAALDYVTQDLPPGAGLWGLVNNAGVASGAAFFHLANPAHFRQTMEVNFFGVVEVTEAFVDLVRASRGRIVNVTSVFAHCSGVAEPYTCSKFALRVYNDGLRRCMADFGVKVCAIEPGFFRTHLTEPSKVMEHMERAWRALPDRRRQMYGGEQFRSSVERTALQLMSDPPLARWNHVEQVTRAMVHALAARNPRSRYVCGLDAWLLYLPLGLAPDWLSDFGLRKRFRFYDVVRRSQ